MTIEKFITDTLIKKAYSLESIGINELAWKKEDAIQVIKELIEIKKAILGGDVYKKNKKLIQPTYDSWYCEMNSNENIDDFSLRSINKSIDYIKNYNEKNNGEYYYTIVV
jgi:hypothetical protein